MSISLSTTVTKTDLDNFMQLANQRKGRFGITIVTITDEHRLQKRALSAILGKVEVKKVSEVSNAIFGWNYESVVQHRIDKEGGNGLCFQTQAPVGKHWVSGMEGICLQADADPAKLYVRSYQSKATKYRNFYLVDGRAATPAEDSAIRQCLRDPSPSHKQHVAGLSEENEVMPRDYTLTNIFGLFVKAWNFSFGIDYDTLLANA